MKRVVVWLAVALAVILSVAVMVGASGGGDTPKTTFNELVSASTDPALTDASFNLASGHATFTINGDEISGPAPRAWMETTAARLAGKTSVTVETVVAEPDPWWRALVSIVAPVLLFGLLLIWFVRYQANGLGKAGKNPCGGRGGGSATTTCLRGKTSLRCWLPVPLRSTPGTATTRSPSLRRTAGCRQ